MTPRTSVTGVLLGVCLVAAAPPAAPGQVGPTSSGGSPVGIADPADGRGASVARQAGFRLADVFDLEWATDPRVSPDGGWVVYVRHGFDRMTDRGRSHLWIVAADGSDHRAVTAGDGDESSPRWSPDGRRLAYVASREEGSEIRLRWMDTDQATVLARLDRSPSGLAWSPDGSRLAFSMFVPEPRDGWVEMPSPPEGADWGEPFRVIEETIYRADGEGYLEPGHRQLFVLPAEGGTPRQVTSGPYDHDDPRWSGDGTALFAAANRHEDAVTDPVNTEIYRVSLDDGSVRPLTERRGPDEEPAVSPDGRWIAYTGFDDRRQGYQVTRLHLVRSDGSEARVATEGLDRSVRAPAWRADGSGVLFLYDDHGVTRVGFVPVRGGEVGTPREVVRDVGGTTLGRPYASGDFSTGAGRVAYTRTSSTRPADVALAEIGAAGSDGPRLLTSLNEDLLGHRALGEAEEIRWESPHDGREIQGWIVEPPGFDPERSYPLLLEIHGGPFANYGPRFSAEIQAYAAAGYVVLYANPRGSTSYGGSFGNLIHHAYPGHDYEDLMAGVDALLERGYVDEDRLFVTGGSGGGVLSAWIVGKTDRFRAAAVAKPVINWYSFALTADNYNYYHRYWFPGPPWEHRDHYMDRSPVSLAEDVSTPTMVMVGEEDHRTPASEAEQLYGALRLRGVPSALVRIPDASHHIAGRPSNLMGKVAHVLGWFARHGGPDPAPDRAIRDR